MRRSWVLAIMLAGCGGEASFDDGSEMLEAEAEDELGGRCTWRVKGRLMVRENATTGDFRDRPLAGMDVRIYGSLLNNGGFGIWGTVRTNSQGYYSLAKRKSCSRRKLRVRARFRGHELTINEPGASDWMRIYESTSTRRSGTLDLGSRKFSLTSYGALRDWGNIQRATFWYTLKTVMDRMKSENSWFAFDRTVRVRYPAWTTNGKSWADGISSTAYIATGDGEIETVLHEVMHLWNYQHNYGTTNWLRAVLGDGSTHGLQEEPNVAFHEGFAAWAQEELRHEIWGNGKPRPVTRWHLGQRELASLSRLERNGAGVRWGLRLLTTPSIYRYVFGTRHSDRYGTVVDRVAYPEGCPSAPQVDFWDVLYVFKANPNRGWSRDWEVQDRDYGLRRFYRRARDILPRFRTGDYDLYLDLLDASQSREPRDRCSGR